MKCAICGAEIKKENPPIFAYGAYGNPRCLCDACDGYMEHLTRGRTEAEVGEARDNLLHAAAENDVTDPTVLEALETFIEDAKVRAEKIAAGTYDFSEDAPEETETADDGATDETAADGEESGAAFDIPEELAETEADRELDRKEEEAAKKSDAVWNWVWLFTLLVAVGMLIWFLFFR